MHEDKNDYTFLNKLYMALDDIHSKTQLDWPRRKKRQQNIAMRKN
jgi:hypothetical protein